jgi:Uma2 family endonuclease
MATRTLNNNYQTAHAIEEGEFIMPLPSEQLHTIEDIYALPEGTRAELIDGQLYMMAPPNRRHQEIVFSLSRKIADYIDLKDGSCKTYIAPFAVFLNQDNLNYVEPDISVICDPNKLTDRGCAGAPDWVIEIVSPSSRRMDYSTKVFKYRSAGVQEYWIVDPDKKRITIWDFENDNTEEFSFSDSVKAGIYPDLFIDFQQLDI